MFTSQGLERTIDMINSKCNCVRAKTINPATYVTLPAIYCGPVRSRTWQDLQITFKTDIAWWITILYCVKNKRCTLLNVPRPALWSEILNKVKYNIFKWFIVSLGSETITNYINIEMANSMKLWFKSQWPEINSFNVKTD